MKRLVSLFIITITILLVGSGCNVNIYNEGRIHRDGLRFLEEKYGSEINFSINHSFTDEINHYMFITVEGQEDWDVRLTWSFNHEEFRDNYMSWVLREEVEAAFLEVLEKIYGEVKLFNSPVGAQARNQFTADTTLEEYLAARTGSSIEAFIPITADQIAMGFEAFQEKAEEDLNRFYQAMLSRDLRIFLNITYISEELFDRLNIDNLREDTNESVGRPRNYYLTGGFMGSIEGKLNWRRGEIEW